jgi:hypothetical protein
VGAGWLLSAPSHGVGGWENKKVQRSSLKINQTKRLARTKLGKNKSLVSTTSKNHKYKKTANEPSIMSTKPHSHENSKTSKSKLTQQQAH